MALAEQVEVVTEVGAAAQEAWEAGSQAEGATTAVVVETAVQRPA